MKTKLVPSAWIEKEGRRLDCGPYLSGAIEAKLLLEKLSVPKEPLHKLTTGHDGGIYNGPHFERTYVSSPDFGVPFLSSSSMLWADLSRVELLSTPFHKYANVFPVAKPALIVASLWADVRLCPERVLTPSACPLPRRQSCSDAPPSIRCRIFRSSAPR